MLKTSHGPIHLSINIFIRLWPSQTLTGSPQPRRIRELRAFRYSRRTTLTMEGI